MFDALSSICNFLDFQSLILKGMLLRSPSHPSLHPYITPPVCSCYRAQRVAEYRNTVLKTADE